MRYRYAWEPMYAATMGRRTGTGPNPDSNLRASDAERNEVADRLSRHFAEGRLDAAEFKERLDRAMGATTRGDLEGLFDDLPRLGPETAVVPAQGNRRRRLIPVMVMVGLLAVVSGITIPYVHFSWILIAAVALLVWQRAGRPHRRHHSDGHDHHDHH